MIRKNTILLLMTSLWAFRLFAAEQNHDDLKPANVELSFAQDRAFLQMLVQALEIAQQVHIERYYHFANDQIDAQETCQKVAEGKCSHRASLAFAKMLGRTIDERICAEDLKATLRGVEFALIKALDWHDFDRYLLNGCRVATIYQLALTTAYDEIQNILQWQGENTASLQEPEIDGKAQATIPQQLSSEPASQDWGEIRVEGIEPKAKFFDKIRGSLQEHIEHIQQQFDGSSFASLMKGGEAVRYRLILDIKKMDNPKRWAFFKNKYKLRAVIIVEAALLSARKTSNMGEINLLLHANDGFLTCKNNELFDVIYNIVFWQVPRLKAEVHAQARQFGIIQTQNQMP